MKTELTDKDIFEFIDIMKDSYGVSLSLDEARPVAKDVLDLIYLIYAKPHKHVYNGVVSRRKLRKKGRKKRY